MSYESERLKILEMIDSGLITVEEGVVLLNALGERGRAEELPPSRNNSMLPNQPPNRKLQERRSALLRCPR